MDAWTAALLGLLQGLTEFLPVSSSGHLVVAQHLLGIRSPSLFLEVMLHGGTLAAVLLFLRRDLLRLARGVVAPRRARGGERRLCLLLLLGSLPAGLTGLSLRGPLARVGLHPVWVGASLLLNGLLLLTARRRGGAGRGLWEVPWPTALLVGAAQALALMPGISRSGATIVAALWAGMHREAAGRFSFLLAVPAMTGAAVLEALRAGPPPGTSWAALAAGCLTAACAGGAALTVLFRVLRRGRLALFAPYCWALGAAVVGASLL